MVDRSHWKVIEDLFVDNPAQIIAMARVRTWSEDLKEDHCLDSFGHDLTSNTSHSAGAEMYSWGISNSQLKKEDGEGNLCQ